MERAVDGLASLSSPCWHKTVTVDKPVATGDPVYLSEGHDAVSPFPTVEDFEDAEYEDAFDEELKQQISAEVKSQVQEIRDQYREFDRVIAESTADGYARVSSEPELLRHAYAVLGIHDVYVVSRADYDAEMAGR